MKSANQFTEIDMGRLEYELRDQPKLYKHYADKLAEAKKELREAEVLLKVNMAIAEKRIRRRPAKYGIKTVRESAIKLEIPLHPLVQQAEALVTQAQYAVNLLTGSTRALEHKKSSLEDLTKLLLSDIWSVPRVPKASDEEVKKHVRRKGRESHE